MNHQTMVPLVVLAIYYSRVLPIESANILAIETAACKSHWNYMSGMLQALVDVGHNVTVFTPYPDGNRENYTEVDVSRGYKKVIGNNVNDLLESYSDPIRTVFVLSALARERCDKVYDNMKLKEMLSNTHSDFDLVLTELFYSDCVSYAANKLGLPLIYITPLPIVSFMERSITGHVSNPALVSDIMTKHGILKTFVQRLSNTIIYIISTLVIKYTELKLKYSEPREYDFIQPTTPSLVFVNAHFVSDAPKPLATNVISVGGIHLKAAQRLPKDILEFIEQSPSGVIYFSFGSTVKMSSLPEHIKKAFLTALAQLPQRVLMKYEEELEDKPKNIMTKKWLPQRDIILHPNVKLFISHGGISGLYETVDAGVPVLGFPLFGDQHRNVDNLVNAGMAISMELMSVTKDSFSKNVLDLLNDEKFTKNAKTASEIFKDRPMSPAQSVVYWTEYVIRHKGAPHLKSHAFNLTWYQYYLLDVISTILIFVFLVIFVTYRFLRLCYKYVSSYFKQIKPKSE